MSPSTRAFSMAVPDTPKTSVATLDNLILAVSSSLSVRLRSDARVSARVRRWRRRSRSSRISSGGTKLGLTRPWRTRSAIHSASFTSVRHRLDVVGIGHDQGEMPFQDRVDRLPVDPGALHADVGHPQLPHPVAQGLEVGGHGAEVPVLLARLLARASDENTDNDAGLVDIQAGGTFNDHVHGSDPAW